MGLSQDMGVFRNEGYHFGGPYEKDYSIWGRYRGPLLDILSRGSLIPPFFVPLLAFALKLQTDVLSTKSLNHVTGGHLQDVEPQYRANCTSV